MKAFEILFVVIFCLIFVRGDLDSENPVKINYDKHGTFLGLEVYCEYDEIEETTLSSTEGTTTTPEKETTTTEETTTTKETSTPEITTTPEITATPEITTTTTTQAPNGCDPCDNEIPGKAVYHQECMRFCVCEPNGGVTIKDCEFGLIWDYPSQRCEDPSNSGCPYTQWSL